MALTAVSGWRDKTESEAEVEDEFACPGVLRGSLLDQKATVQQVFRVVLIICGEEHAYRSQDGQIWLQLKGRKKDVEAAKLFVIGVVNQEAQDKVQYPDALHCVFCGAKRFFMLCLIRMTSAHIAVSSRGYLLISGLAEPVVKACSLIMNLVHKYISNQGQVADVVGQSLESRRAFKSLVERLEDRHTLELLALPVGIKEALLDLVEQSGMDPNSLDSSAISADSKTVLELQENRLMLRELTGDRAQQVVGNSAFHLKPNSPFPPHSQHPDVLSKSNTYSIKDPRMNEKEHQPRAVTCSREEPPGHFFPYSVRDTRPRFHTEAAERKNRETTVQKKSGAVPQDMEEERESEELEEILLSTGSKQEYEHLLKFFTAMGFDEEVVCRVLARTGPMEASQALDLIQQEQDKQGIDAEHSNTNISDQEDFNGMGSAALNGVPGAKEDDFVLNVLKKAAASCGYTEDKVMEVYSNLPELTPHELILELQKQSMQEQECKGDSQRKHTEHAEENQRQTKDLQRMGEAIQDLEDKRHSESNRADDTEKNQRQSRDSQRMKDAIQQHEGKRDSEKNQAEDMKENRRKATDLQKMRERDLREDKKHEQFSGKSEATKKEGKTLREKPKRKEDVQVTGREGSNPEARMQPCKESSTTNWTSKPSSPPKNQPFHTVPPSVRGPPQPTYHSALHPNISEQIAAPTEQSATKSKYKQGPPPSRVGTVVTGAQRFLEGLETPFNLQLEDETGDPKLSQIIIDGSNVAMSHGLGTFFSCRGIALAVQYFWSRGHRKISVFVPQWRQKRDPKIKEQHFMTQLQDLGLLSFTPSREVMGQRINCYDDRIMLQFAQKTNGVIVTNDNMRDLVDESVVWREIIKKRLLQYVFAGDLFMVPDDPLGRSGPHINEFLRAQSSPPLPASHSFAGMSSSPLPTPQPRARTEVLQYRERSPGGIARAPKSGQAQCQNEREGNRSVEETLQLKESLVQIFPGQDSVVMMTLQCYPTLTDINQLSHFILEQQRDKQE